jgi:hypothetical protein
VWRAVAVNERSVHYMECMQVHVLARMEAVGMGLDLHSLLVQRLPLRRWLAKLEKRALKVRALFIHCVFQAAACLCPKLSEWFQNWRAKACMCVNVCLQR